jgi:hypothetical protein
MKVDLSDRELRAKDLVFTFNAHVDVPIIPVHPASPQQLPVSSCRSRTTISGHHVNSLLTCIGNWRQVAGNHHD